MTTTNRIVETLGYVFGFLWKFGLAIVLLTDKFPPNPVNLIFSIIAVGFGFVSVYRAIGNIIAIFKEASECNETVRDVYSNVRLFIEAMMR